MSRFTLQQGGFTSYTSIPNCFIEQFMPYASGEFVKIYIYLLKCVNENKSELSISKIADAFNNTEKDVVRALKYWQKKGLLELTFDADNTLKSLQFLPFTGVMEYAADDEGDNVKLSVTDAPVPGNPANNIKHGKTAAERRAEALKAVSAEKPELLKSAAAENPAADNIPAAAKAADMQMPEEPAESENKAAAKREYTKAEIAEFSTKEDAVELLFIVEKYLGRTLSATDVNTVLFLYDDLKFSAELIEYLFEYCVGKNHKNMRYIEKTGIAWAEQGIKTVGAAKTMAAIYSDECYKVLNAFGINSRKPTKNETDFVTKWTFAYGFDIQIILVACSKTMDRIHQPNFEYTDGILSNWRSKNVKTVDDIKKLDQEFETAAGRREQKRNSRPANRSIKTQFNDFPQREYDFSKLEKKLFNQ